jgi:predicted small lipoprotein YifL
MILRLCLVLALALPAAACGTKSELLLPDGKQTVKNQKDPSQPPSPIAR